MNSARVNSLQSEAENLAGHFPPLQIEAERVAMTIWQGLHGRRRAGTGEAFWQFRRYEPYDSAQRIDWRQSARSDKVFVREREWEAAQTAYLWADSSGSMQFQSKKNIPKKSERAQLLMLALASLLLRGDEKVYWLDERRSLAVHGRKGLQHIMERLGSREGSSLPPRLDFARASHMVLCSDFLSDTAALTDLMKEAAARHLKGTLVHIMDPAEKNLQLTGRVEITGLENEAPILLSNANSLTDAYQERLGKHLAFLKDLCVSGGFSFASHTTSEPPYSILMNIYQYLKS